VKIVVFGGAGLISSRTISILHQGGHEVVAASLKSGIDTPTVVGVEGPTVRERTVKNVNTARIRAIPA
jgi:nucleoside-diphosphate-sugar epimerase